MAGVDPADVDGGLAARRARQTRSRRRSRPGFVLPGARSGAGLAILVVGTLHHTSRVAIGLATATLVVGRHPPGLSARGLRTLTDDAPPPIGDR